jgi:CubicO group peptidase (beta-lactamase class C family)
MQAPIHGRCDQAFIAVRDAFINNFIEHGEIGASVCITVNGVTVVDLWGGFSEPDKTTPWQEDQLVNVFSIGKGVTAVLAAQCVAGGLVSYDTRIVSVWPEFAVHGKEGLTLRDLLGHRAGLPAVRTRLPADAIFNWKIMTESLATEKPWWTPGHEHGYHVNTYGFLVGEVLRRATGKTIGQLTSELIATPLNAEIYLGTPSHLHNRIADFEWPGDPFPELEPAGLDEEQLLQFNTYYNPSGISGAGVVNTAPWRLAEMPSTNVHASSRAVATLYTSLAHGGTHENVTLLPHDVLATATSEVSIGNDRILHRTSRFAHGFQLPIPERGFGPNIESFGHFGAGGSVGFCDPVAKVGFGYVMNQMGPRWQNPRNRALIDSLYSCLTTNS